MTNAIKAALWSGLVFPGLGQLILKYYKRGIALTLATAICFYLLIERVVVQAMDIVSKIDLSGGVVDGQVIASAAREASKVSDTGTIKFVVGALLVIWLVGIVDAYVMGKRKDRQGPTANQGKQK